MPPVFQALKKAAFSLKRRTALFLSQALNFPGWKQSTRKLPALRQLFAFPRSLTFRERVALSTGIALTLAGLILIGSVLYVRETVTVSARGGTFTEGVSGQVLFINPVIPATTADRDLVVLTYAGLMRYNAEGELEPDIAEQYALGEFGKVIEFTLKNDLKWPDGEKVTAEDVIFTVQLVQNPAVRSPFFTQWLGVEAEAMDERTVRFTLPAPFAPLLHATTLGILPKHLWQDVEPENISLSELNLKPVGLGPYRLAKFERTREGVFISFTLERNESSRRQPYIDSVILRLFETPQDALSAFTRQELDAVSGISESMLNDITLTPGTHVMRPPMPRIFAVYFNQTLSKALADSVVRKALAYATDKNKILETLGGQEAGEVLNGPLPKKVKGFTNELPVYDYAPEHSRNILEADGWAFPEENTSDNTEGETPRMRRKGEEPNVIELRVTITTTEGELENVAQTIAEQWRAVGVGVDIQVLPAAELRDTIEQRSYTALLVGVDIFPDPDLFTLFHSSQKFDPGRNLALYDNDNVDDLLQEGRKLQDPDMRQGVAQKVQQLIAQDLPAIFLWSERFHYIVDNRVKEVTIEFLPASQHRFATIEKWYVVTKRVPK